jgi:predicted O-methyltransferase YrrM
MSDRVQGHVRKGLQSVGVQTWGTKSFEFWTLLSAALWIVRPRSILELGSGRSTSYLGDYAQKEAARFVSIEQNRGFARRVRIALRAGFVDPACVQHVAVRDGWYDLERVREVAPRPCELLFVDGPVGEQESLGSARRGDEAATSWLLELAAETRAIVVDDLQRPENVVVADQLVAAANAEPLYLDYAPQPGSRNVAMIAVAAEHASALRAAADDVGIAVYADRARIAGG